MSKKSTNFWTHKNKVCPSAAPLLSLRWSFTSRKYLRRRCLRKFRIRLLRPLFGLGKVVILVINRRKIGNKVRIVKQMTNICIKLRIRKTISIFIHPLPCPKPKCSNPPYVSWYLSAAFLTNKLSNSSPNTCSNILKNSPLPSKS